MNVTFDTRHAAVLLRAADGDFDLLREAVRRIREQRLVFTIRPDQIQKEVAAIKLGQKQAVD